ncbi:MAG: hypothetical protein P9M03_04815, partial [Candidatus Theseobacter exili]|nr:hypothetical protein [Candidatus Theseobacter exili]
IVGAVTTGEKQMLSLLLWGGFSGSQKAFAEHVLGVVQSKTIGDKIVFSSGECAIVFLHSNLLWIGHSELASKIISIQKDRKLGLKSNRKVRKVIRSSEKGETFWMVWIAGNKESELTLLQNSPLNTLFQTLKSFSLSLTVNGSFRGSCEGLTDSKGKALNIKEAAQEAISSYVKLLMIKDEKLVRLSNSVKYSVQGRTIYIQFRWKRNDALQFVLLLAGQNKNAVNSKKTSKI